MSITVIPEPWEKALEAFLGEWRRRPGVEGAVLGGSRAQGTDDAYSDVDVWIVLANRLTWRERGLRRIGGYTIEYFANPARMYPKYFEQAFGENVRSNARVFAHGRVLWDRRGAVARLQRWAQSAMVRPFRRSDRTAVESLKYGLWDTLDGLRSARASRNPSFWRLYHLGLEFALGGYSPVVGAEQIAPARAWQYLTDDRFRRGYHLERFPDARFARLFAACLTAKTPPAALARFARLTGHVHRRLGGFDPRNWRLRTRAV